MAIKYLHDAFREWTISIIFFQTLYNIINKIFFDYFTPKMPESFEHRHVFA